MANIKKIALYSGAVGLITPFVVKLIAKLPTVQLTLSTIEVNVRQNVGTLTGQGGTVGEYVLSLLGSPFAGGAMIGLLYTIVGMIALGIGGYWLAEQFGWANTKLQRAVVPLALASVIAGIVVIPILGGAAIGLGLFSVESIILAINLVLGASVVTGLNFLFDDPLNLIP